MNRQPWPFPPEWAVAWGVDELSPFPFVEVELAPGVTTRLRWIPPGRFLMGSPESEGGRSEDEVQHWVSLTRGFWLGETACTQREWEAVMGDNPSRFKDESQSPERPVEQVSWEECAEFLERAQQGDSGLELRLPTEAEWEYACRAKVARGNEYESVPFSFGATITTEQVNYDGDFPYGRSPKGERREKTVPVRSLPPNHWGLYEMHGNVWEWCGDWYGEYAVEEQRDPVGPEMGQFRVLRGGSWYDVAWNCRSAQRYWYLPVLRGVILGFRLLAVQPGEPG